MKNIIVFYPKYFNSYTKFSRKIKKITSNLGAFKLLYTNDSNGFIQRISKDNSNISHQSIDWPFNDYTHAIIFDDGEEFVKESTQIKENGKPLRLIHICITRVINIKNQLSYQSEKNTQTYEYIGRGSYWGNPHSMYEDGCDREEVIRKYKYDFDFDKFPNKEKQEVHKLAGKRLGCFCKPQACHGDILADFLNSWDDGI